MAVSIIKQPATIAFSRNPNWWGFQTDNLYSNTGTVSAYFLHFDRPLLHNETFTLEYGDNRLSFEVNSGPDDSGLQVRSGFGLDMLQWCTQLADDLEGNFLLSRDFVIGVDLTGVDPRVSLTARVADPAYDLLLDREDSPMSLILLANGVKRAKHPNFSLWAELLVSNADNTAFEVVQTNIPLDVNDDGTCYPNMSKTLTESLIGKNADYEQPDPALPVVQRNRKTCRRYYIRYAEQYGSKQTIKKVKETPVKWVMLGGTGKATHETFSIADTFHVGGFHLFLKQEAATKTVTKKQREWLSLVWLTGDIALLKLKVKTYFTEGDPVEHDAFTVADVAKYDKITFPAGHTQLNLPGLYLDKMVSHYEVWLTNSLNERVSEVRTYQMNYKYDPYAKWFHSLSSLGGYDTFYTTGEGSTEYQLVMERATLTKSHTFKFEDGEIKEFNPSLEHKEKVLSGFLTKRELKRYRDFFLSWNKFEVKNDRAYPIVLNSKSIKELKDSENLYYIEFETGHAFSEDAWTEEAEDAAAGVPVDVSAFWPAVSVPDPVDFDHLYYRRPEVYNRAEDDAWRTEMLNIEATHHAEHAALIDALTLSLAGKSNTDHLHTGVYVTVGEYNDFVVKVGAALIYKGAWVAGYSIDPEDPEVVLGYAINDVVDYAGTLWRGLVIDNEAVPGTDAAKWVKIIDPKTPLEVVAGITLDWQADLIPGKDYTWAQKYGNELPGIAGVWLNKAGIWELFSGFQLLPTYAGETLLTVAISADIYPIKINFI